MSIFLADKFIIEHNANEVSGYYLDPPASYMSNDGPET
jgi:hypothetical protein